MSFRVTYRQPRRKTSTGWRSKRPLPAYRSIRGGLKPGPGISPMKKRKKCWHYFAIWYRFSKIHSEGGSNGRKETQTKRSIHETGSARLHAWNGRRNQGNPPHRTDQKALGLHQEERSS